jgi:thioester reductase-like protein
LGVKVTIIASNIADKDDVSRIMQLFSKDRPLRGVVHAAGVVDSGVLSSMTQDRCEITIAPKAHGAWLLHQATKHMDLDIFLMLSSISGVLGMQGLANYAAANTFLDALAHYRCAQGLPATSIALGTMAGDGGMASRLGRNTLSHLAQFGLDSLSVDQGLKLMESAVISKRALTVAAVLDLERLRHFLEQHGGVISPLLTLLLPKRIIQGQNSLSKQKSLAEMLSEANSGQQADLVLSMVRKVVAKTLGFADYLGVEVDRPLKDIGIDSLTAVQIRNQLATLTGLKLSVNIAFIHPNLKALSQYLLSQLEEASSASTIVPSALLDMDAIRSGCLDSGFKFGKQFTNDSPDRFTRPPESVFLTGATGFVGAFILHELLNKGIFSHCLVRADSMDQARQRLKYTLQDYDLWKPAFEPLIQPVIGDMNQPLLGLTEETFEELASKVDTICHSGALVDWMRPLEDYIGPNIVSAHEVLRLASRGRRKSVHLISTISTLPKHMGIELKEGDLEYGYGTSKYIAEKMVTAARWRGATASIYRLPYVTASTATGHFRQDQGDFLHNLIKGCLEMGNFPLLDADLSAVLPVDYLAKTVVALMTTHLHSKGRDYDFLNTRAPSCSEFFNHIVTLSSGRMKGEVPFSAWKKQALAYAIAHPKSSLARITAVLDNYTNQNASSMFKGLSVGEHVLGGDYYPAPAIDENFVKEYLQRINE